MKTIKINEDKLVEVLDNTGKALLSMPLSMCLKQKLTREIAIVFIINNENKLILTRKKASKQSKNSNTSPLWDIPLYTNVYADEISIEAALRILAEEFNLKPTSLQNIIRIPITQEDNIGVFADFFITNKIDFQEEKNTVYRQNKEIMFISIEELKAIISHTPEVFTPELIWAIQASWIK